MAKYVVNVEKKVYCELEIEGEEIGPSANFIVNIQLHDGMGIAVPTLTLYLQDPSGNLENKMNLVEGLKCSITLSRDGIADRRIKRTYRLWNTKRENTSNGPSIKVVFVYDSPKFATSVYCESFRTTSDGVMSEIASASGLEYDGPEGGTDDEMNWLNLHTTRSSFTEDVAMRGYANSSSCMYKILTMDNVLKYKDMLAEFKKDVVVTFAKDTDAAGKQEPIYAVRESKEIEGGGLATHWMNYGFLQHNHSLDAGGPTYLDGIDAPVYGNALTVNEKVRSALDAPSRVTYAGLDPGTEPKDSSNIHEYYESALYQNLRGLCLFSNRLRVLVDAFTEVTDFDMAEYVQKDVAGDSETDSVAHNGKYIVVGKIISIKNGIQYSEIFDLARPYSHVGNPIKSGGQNNGAKSGNANASGNMAEERASELAAANTNIQPQQIPLSQKPTTQPKADQLNNVMGSLVAFDKTNPAIPEVPLPAAGSLSEGSPEVSAQRDLAKAIDSIKASGNDLSDAITVSPDDFNVDRAMTVKKINASAVETSANNAMNLVISNEANANVGLRGLGEDTLKSLDIPVEKTVMDRFTLDTGTDPLKAIKEEKLKTVISAATSSNIQLNSFVTDPLKGGIMAQDYIDQGSNIPTLAEYEIVDAVRQSQNAGTNFLFPASKFGLTAEDVLIRPQSVVDYAERFVDDYSNPERVLATKGADVYMETFGTRMPRDAYDVVDSIRQKIPLLKDAYSASEVIAGDPTKTGQESGFVVGANNVLKLGRTIGIDPRIEVSNYRLTGIIADGISGVKNDTGYSKMFNFRFGQEGVGPLLEKAVNKERITTSDGVYATTDVIEMNREVLSWNSFARMGNNNSKQEAESNPNAPQPDNGTGQPDADYKQWSYPTTASIATFSEGVGSAFSFTNSRSIS